jgi:hypothetical protein
MLLPFAFLVEAQDIGLKDIGDEELIKAAETAVNFLEALKTDSSFLANKLIARFDFGIPGSEKETESLQADINILNKILGNFINYKFIDYQKVTPPGSQEFSYLYFTYEAKFTNSLVDVYLTLVNLKDELKISDYQFVPHLVEFQKEIQLESFGQVPKLK